MCDRLRLGLAAALTLALASSAAAQDARVLERRSRQFDVLRRDAVDALVRAQRLRFEPLDTVQAGALTVVARPSDVPPVSRAVVIAWGKLDSLYGDIAQRLAPARFLFFRQGFPIQNVPPALKDVPRVMGAADGTETDFAFQLMRASSLAIGHSSDSVFTTWLGPLLLQDANPVVERSHVYVELVTAPSSAVQRCYGGAMQGCAAALGLLEGDQAPLWYDAVERRTMVLHNQDIAQRFGLQSTADQCLDRRSDTACLQVLRSLPWLEPPLSTEARQSLTRLAVAVGGRRAFVRLAESGAPLAQRLSAAAGMPLDSLLQQWRRLVIAERPRPVPVTRSSAWMALGWGVLFGLMALRSTRWR